MVNRYTVTLALVGGVLVLIGIVVDTLKENTLALMAFIVLIVLPLAGVLLLQAWQLTHERIKPQARTHNDDQPAQLIDGSWHVVEDPEPQALLAAPASVPRKVN